MYVFFICVCAYSTFIFHSCLYPGKLPADVMYMLLDELQKKGRQKFTYKLLVVC